MTHFKTVGVIGKHRSPQVAPVLNALCRHLQELGRTVLVDTYSADLVDEPVSFVTRADLARRCDLVVVVGGDGTLLAAARELAPAGVPLLGINQGRLGFMVDVTPEDMRESLAAIFAGEFVREDRLLLSCRILRNGEPVQPVLAVNDVVIRNQAAIRMLEFETWIEGEFISQHRADGFIIASPTGSTAYALSGGGPVVHPSLDALALVPICPHTLSDRPIVVSARQAVRLVLGGAEGTRVMLTCDGQTSEILQPGDAVEVSRADWPLSLIHPKNYSYFNLLRNKLHWGRGPAQRKPG
ncbi:NAD(+) kinase [Solimonas sp. K1W22B-7]|uniref:NAD(+) kinase n=1 Tax=Solimonas sp. K1W22B-7 TaxID=2303331 RepID=UPI000E32F803|nr:NAD(+) kinase [Solimonas sp. K1W22B-7]AXQ29266.1 NAD(+) kinase [Solimonas sp. K1W22B-7]